MKSVLYLHTRQIVHWDLKLANLLLKNNIIKLADFGLAAWIVNGQDDCVSLCGTPNYMCPEILRREVYGLKADSWSLGCILYTLATGSPPF